MVVVRGSRRLGLGHSLTKSPSHWVRQTLLALQVQLLLCQTRRGSPTVCFLRIPHPWTCLTLSLGQELMGPKWPLVILLATQPHVEGRGRFSTQADALVHSFALRLGSPPAFSPRGQAAWHGAAEGHGGRGPGVHLRLSLSPRPGDLASPRFPIHSLRPTHLGKLL